MPIIVKKRMILVEAKQSRWTNKANNEIVEKWRYKFVEPDPTSKSGFKYTLGYDDGGVYKDKVQSIEKWDDNKAIDVFWACTEFQGEDKLKLYTQGLGNA